MSVIDSKSGFNRLFPFAKKKPNIPVKLSDKVDLKTNKQIVVEDKNCLFTETVRYDVLTKNNEKGKLVLDKNVDNETPNRVSLDSYRNISSLNDSKFKSKIKNTIIRKSSNVSEVGAEDIKKPKDNYQRWNIPFSSKFKGKDFDKTLLTMQDLIYYNPDSNPIIKKEKIEHKEEDDPDDDLLKIEPDLKPTVLNNCITPCIKVGIDGKIIIDQETLTLNETGLEEKREELAKSKVIVESAFHSRNYSYKRKREPSKQWTKYETLRFYKCLMNLGTDFSMIGQYFPSRTRTQIKRKYKTEEKKNPQLINGALSNTIHYNGDFLESMLEEDDKLGILEDIKTKTKTIQLNSQKRIHKDIVRSDCGRMSVCAYMMEEEIVLKKKRKLPKKISTASNLKEDVLALQLLKSNKNLKTQSKNKNKTLLLDKIDKEDQKNKSLPKVRRLQDFHEEYEENISKYEEESNSD